MTSADAFNVFVWQDPAIDPTVTGAAGLWNAGKIQCGGGGVAPMSLSIAGWPYACAQRVSGSTAGTIKAAGIAAVPVTIVAAVTPTPNTLAQRDGAGNLSAVEYNGGAGAPAILRGATGVSCIATAGNCTTTANGAACQSTVTATGTAANGAGGVCALLATGDAANCAIFATGGNGGGTGPTIACAAIGPGSSFAARGTNAAGEGTESRCSGAGVYTVWTSGVGAGARLLRMSIDALGRMALGTAAADASAILDLSQNAALGLGLPAATRATILALANPLAGLTLFDATNRMVVTNTGTPGAPIWSRVSGGPNIAAGTALAPSIPNNVSTVVAGWTAQTNTGANFVPATGIFTAPVLGFYEFESEIQFAAVATAVATELRIEIMVNGTVVRRGTVSSHTATSAVKQSPNVEISITLLAGDNLTMNAFQNSGGAVALTADATTNYFCGEIVQ